MADLRYRLRAKPGLRFRCFPIYSNAQMGCKNAKDHTPGGSANPGGYGGYAGRKRLSHLCAIVGG